jgi:hypothetical protein
MTISEYIAINNLKGVQKFASDNGYSIPNDAREAYLLLKSIHNRDEQEAIKVLSELHPDGFLFKRPAVVEPKKEKKSATNNFKNMADCGCMKNATGDFGTSIESITNQGIAYTENAVNQGVDKIRQAVKEKNDDLMRNLLFFGAGFIVCKLLFK